MLTRREENLATGNRNSTIQRLTAAARSDGTLVALVGEFVNATGWDGWAAPTDGPMKMLYDCENVRTVLSPAKINTPPMKAFRAPGFVEGTFGLECLLDELAAKLDMDPLEIRSLNYAHSTDDRPYSSKNLMECYKRAEPHWQRRDEVRARSSGPWKSRRRPRQPDLVRRRRPALLRVGASRLRRPRDGRDGDAGHRHGHGDDDDPDRRRGARAAARAGRPRARRLRAWALRVDLRGILDCPLDGPGRSLGSRRRRPADHRDRRAALRQGGARPVAEGGHVLSSDGGSWPIEEVVGLLEDAQILGKGARGPNPTGMQVLTFGVQVAEVAVDVETGEIRVERVAAIHDVGRVVNPLGASSQVEGGIIQGIGHTLSEDRLLDPASGIIAQRRRSTPTSCRRSPTCPRSSPSCSTFPTST